jgi:nitric oxide dioxygenase
VYWIMAQTLIDLECALYAQAGVDDGDVYRRARVLSRVDDPSGVILVTVRPAGDGRAGEDDDAAFLPGQYISVGVTMPDGARQIRQYSLVNLGGTGELTFGVKPVAATADQPFGEVSTWIRDNLHVGDLLDITVPFGDLPTPQPGIPLVLISAGIGITPMIGILESVVATDPGTRVQILHADRSDQSHPLRERQHELLAQLPNATLDVWYEDGLTHGVPGAHPGRLQLDTVDLTADAEVYLCGGDGFVRAVRDELLARGVGRVHCELFSPNDWLL